MNSFVKFGFTFGLVGSVLLSYTNLAHAQRVSSMQAGRLLQLCTRSSGVQICEAYITGMADSVALTKVFDKNQGDSTAPAGFCIPASTTGMQMRNAVVAWLKSKKDHLHEPVGGLVYTALHETFPCKGAEAKPAEDHAPSQSGLTESKGHQ